MANGKILQIFQFFSLFLNWGFYSIYAPGGEFFGIYRKIVLYPGTYFTNPAIFNPPWIFPILTPFILMPDRIGFIAILFLLIISIFYATKIFGGNIFVVLFSAQMAWLLWWGQIDWLGIVGIALAWQAYKKKSWLLMGTSILLVAIKPQIGLFAVLFLWFNSDDRKKSAFFVLLMFLLSLGIWGLWPISIMDHIINFVNGSSFELWNSSIGLYAFPAFLLLLIVKPMEKKYLAAVAISLLVSPYLPYYSTLILLCFPIPPWAYIFGIIGFLPNIIGTTLAWKALVFLPISLLAWIYWEDGIWVYRVCQTKIQNIFIQSKVSFK